MKPLSRGGGMSRYELGFLGAEGSDLIQLQGIPALCVLYEDAQIAPGTDEQGYDVRFTSRVDGSDIHLTGTVTTTDRAGRPETFEVALIAPR